MRGSSALEAFERWPSCQHFLLQASNMLWFKPGMELAVRRLDCSVSEWAIREPNNYLRKALRHPFTKAMLAPPQVLKAAGQAEIELFGLEALTVRELRQYPSRADSAPAVPDSCGSGTE